MLKYFAPHTHTTVATSPVIQTKRFNARYTFATSVMSSWTWAISLTELVPSPQFVTISRDVRVEVIKLYIPKPLGPRNRALHFVRMTLSRILYICNPPKSAMPFAEIFFQRGDVGICYRDISGLHGHKLFVRLKVIAGGQYSGAHQLFLQYGDEVQ